MATNGSFIEMREGYPNPIVYMCSYRAGVTKDVEGENVETRRNTRGDCCVSHHENRTHWCKGPLP